MSTSITSNVNFFMMGTAVGSPATIPNIQRNINLYANGSGFINTNANISSSINFFVKNTTGTRGSSTASINLFIKGRGKTFNRSINLFTNASPGLYPPPNLYQLTLDQLSNLSIDNLYNLPLYANPISSNIPTLLSNSINLFVRSLGGATGFHVTQSSINLVITGPNGISRSVNLYSRGLIATRSNINLFTKGVIGVLNKNINLYIRGNTPVITPINLFTRGYVDGPYDPSDPERQNNDMFLLLYDGFFEGLNDTQLQIMQ